MCLFYEAMHNYGLLQFNVPFNSNLSIELNEINPDLCRKIHSLFEQLVKPVKNLRYLDDTKKLDISFEDSQELIVSLINQLEISSKKECEKIISFFDRIKPYHAALLGYAYLFKKLLELGHDKSAEQTLKKCFNLISVPDPFISVRKANVNSDNINKICYVACLLAENLSAEQFFQICVLIDQKIDYVIKNTKPCNQPNFDDLKILPHLLEIIHQKQQPFESFSQLNKIQSELKLSLIHI